jgi:hypothetical protein
MVMVLRAYHLHLNFLFHISVGVEEVSTILLQLIVVILVIEILRSQAICFYGWVSIVLNYSIKSSAGF